MKCRKWDYRPETIPALIACAASYACCRSLSRFVSSNINCLSLSFGRSSSSVSKVNGSVATGCKQTTTVYVNYVNVLCKRLMIGFVMTRGPAGTVMGESHHMASGTLNTSKISPVGISGWSGPLNPLDARRRYTDFAQTSICAGLRYTVRTACYRTRRQTVYLRYGV